MRLPREVNLLIFRQVVRSNHSPFRMIERTHFAASPVQTYGSVAVLLVVSATFLYLRFFARSLPAIRSGLFDVLRSYQPGVFYDWHHSRAIAAGFGRCWCVVMPHDPTIFGTVDPAAVEHVLKDPIKWEKGNQWRTAFSDLLGEGIFNADGQNW